MDPKLPKNGVKNPKIEAKSPQIDPKPSKFNQNLPKSIKIPQIPPKIWPKKPQKIESRSPKSPFFSSISIPKNRHFWSNFFFFWLKFRFLGVFFWPKFSHGNFFWGEIRRFWGRDKQEIPWGEFWGQMAPIWGQNLQV